MEGQLNSKRGTYTFLFDADNDALGGYYGTPCREMLFGAVLSRQQPICARVYSGDMVLAQHCQQIAAVKKFPIHNSHADYCLTTILKNA